MPERQPPKLSRPRPSAAVFQSSPRFTASLSAFTSPLQVGETCPGRSAVLGRSAEACNGIPRAGGSCSLSVASPACRGWRPSSLWREKSRDLPFQPPARPRYLWKGRSSPALWTSPSALPSCDLHSAGASAAAALPPGVSFVPQTNLLLLVAYDGTAFSGWAANLAPAARTLLLSAAEKPPQSSAASSHPEANSPASQTDAEVPSASSAFSAAFGAAPPPPVTASWHPAAEAPGASLQPRQQLRTVEGVLRQAFAAVHPLSRDRQRELLSLLSARRDAPSVPAGRARSQGSGADSAAAERDASSESCAAAQAAELAGLRRGEGGVGSRPAEPGAAAAARDETHGGGGAEHGEEEEELGSAASARDAPEGAGADGAAAEGSRSSSGASAHATQQNPEVGDPYYEAFVERRTREWSVLLSEIEQAELQARTSLRSDRHIRVKKKDLDVATDAGCCGEQTAQRAQRLGARATAPPGDHAEAGDTGGEVPEIDDTDDDARAGGGRSDDAGDKNGDKEGDEDDKQVESRMPLVAPPIILRPASRTDRGVHAAGALCQYVSYYHPLHLPLESFVSGANRRLPADVRILAALDLNVLARQGVFAKSAGVADAAELPAGFGLPPQEANSLQRSEARDQNGQRPEGEGDGALAPRVKGDEQSRASPSVSLSASSALSSPSSRQSPPASADDALCASVPTIYKLAQGKHYTYFLSLSSSLFPLLRHGCWTLAEDPRLRNWALQAQNLSRKSRKRADARACGARASPPAPREGDRGEAGVRRGEAEGEAPERVSAEAPAAPGAPRGDCEPADDADLFSVRQRRESLFKALTFDLEKMREAAKAMEGEHSFAAFRCEYSGKEKARLLTRDNPVCRMRSVTISPIEFDPWPQNASSTSPGSSSLSRQPSPAAPGSSQASVFAPPRSPSSAGSCLSRARQRGGELDGAGNRRDGGDGGMGLVEANERDDMRGETEARSCARASFLSRDPPVFSSPCRLRSSDLPQGCVPARGAVHLGSEVLSARAQGSFVLTSGSHPPPGRRRWVSLSRCASTCAPFRIRIDVVGNRFLYKMVRKMVGALVQVALGRLSVADIRHALVHGRLQPLDRQKNGGENDLPSSSADSGKPPAARVRGVKERDAAASEGVRDARRGEDREPLLASGGLRTDPTSFRDSGILCAPAQGLTLQKVFLPQFLARRLYSVSKRDDPDEPDTVSERS
ncbi:hypothetical protein BESB_016600 [Besnoitia besnoiti]|uniref:Pseudouridine synthase I TruA alpha/beta domain-containing protein n=1 Tax=Besnoitia besnoiti TaxID=94643 RepID=A0A2A9MAD4_BESBE|nr:hypothetical protein BESB_016600 [Besnoitia besnoiti]PFH32342.1 hypothetical protein BESB_016600 [Besnoitia besnoiti]